MSSNISKYTVVTLRSGVRIANFSSPHSFIFNSGRRRLPQKWGQLVFSLLVCSASRWLGTQTQRFRVWWINWYVLRCVDRLTHLVQEERM